jgi:hypothetical protein
MARLQWSRAPRSASVSRWSEGGPQIAEMADVSQLSLPTDVGIHVMSVSAEWAEGDASYAFVVEVAGP